MKNLRYIFVRWVLKKFVCTCEDAIGIGTHAVCGKDDLKSYLLDGQCQCMFAHEGKC